MSHSATLLGARRALLGELVGVALGDHAINAGPPPAGRAMGDANQLAMLDYSTSPTRRSATSGGSPPLTGGVSPSVLPPPPQPSNALEPTRGPRPNRVPIAATAARRVIGDRGSHTRRRMLGRGVLDTLAASSLAKSAGGAAHARQAIVTETLVTLSVVSVKVSAKATERALDDTTREEQVCGHPRAGLQLPPLSLPALKKM